MQSLHGNVAGVQIVSSGAPGNAPTVRIRGLGSFPGISDSEPLYVVDGMYFDDIDFLNTSDIETLSVLKDASAAAIYGVRAANGVVLITTKSGSKKGRATITYDGYVGVQVAQNVLQMANAEQFVNYINQVGDPADLSFIDNAMQRFGRSRINPNVPDVNTDWYKEIMNTAARQQNHAISVSGGDENSTYSLGTSYFEQEGLLKGKNSYERFNIRGKFDQQINNWLKGGINVNVSNGTKYIAENAAWFKAYHAVPILPVYDPENYEALVAAGKEFPSPYSNAKLLGYRNTQNPFIDLENRNNRQDIRKVFAGINFEIDLLPERLTFKTNYNLDLIHLSSRNVGLPYYLSTTDDVNRELSSISKSRGFYLDQFWGNTLSYTCLL
jgi:TonB-dependent SusC/RagA subfamily outer membrane receptor